MPHEDHRTLPRKKPEDKRESHIKAYTTEQLKEDFKAMCKDLDTTQSTCLESILLTAITNHQGGGETKIELPIEPGLSPLAMAQRREAERNDPELDDDHEFNNRVCPECHMGMYDDGPVLECPFPAKVWSKCSGCGFREQI